MDGIRKFSTEIKDVNYKQGIVTVYANSFNNLDSDHDISLPGSFKKTIKDNFARVKWFLNHDRTQLLGVPITAKEDNFGLLVEGQLNMKKDIAKDILEDYQLYAEHGRTLEHSIMVNAVKSEIIEGDAVPLQYRKQGLTWMREVSEWKWWEYSTLTSWGADKNTPMVSIKNIKDVQSTIDWLNAMLKGNYTDERLQKVEETITVLQSLKDEPLQTTLITEPGDNTQNDEPIDVNEILNKYKHFKV